MNDHKSLVNAIKQVDVVISTVGNMQIPDQTKIIVTIKEAGNVKVCFKFQSRPLFLNSINLHFNTYIIIGFFFRGFFHPSLGLMWIIKMQLSQRVHHLREKCKSAELLRQKEFRSHMWLATALRASSCLHWFNREPLLLQEIK